MSEPTHPSSETLPHGRTPQGGDEQRVLALFEEWLLLRDQGRDVTVAELCRDCPHLSSRLAEEISLHLRFEPTVPSHSGQPGLPVKEFAGLRYQPLRFH